MVLHKLEKNGVWVQVGKTEVLKDNLNPKFEKKFELDYFFEEVQSLRFEIQDIDGNGSVDDVGM